MGPGVSGCADWARYTVVLTVLSVPFWILGLLPLPGFAAGLPLSGAMAVCPAVAVLCVGRRHALGGWLRRCLRGLLPASLSGWVEILYAPLMPVVLLVAALLHGSSLLRLLEARPWIDMLTLVLPLIVAAITEEIGWTAWLLPRLSLAWGRLRAEVVIGLTWGVWHCVPYVQAGNSADWVAGQILFSLIFRLLIVEASAGAPAALFLPVLLHATYNMAWQGVLLSGSTYSPWTTAAVTALVLGAVLFARHCPRTSCPGPTG